MNDISDEQLARFLTGQATSDEASLVQDACAQSDESMEDILNMVAAIELHQKNASGKVRPAARSVWRYWVAAAVLLLLVGSVSLHYYLRPDTNMDEAPVYATQDTIDTDTVTEQELTFQN